MQQPTRPITKLFKNMKRGWAFLFGAWVLVWLGSELCAHWVDAWLANTGWLKERFGCAAVGVGRTVFMLVLLFMELIGLKSGMGKGGDTLSELFRDVLNKFQDRWASVGLGGGIGVALALRIASLPFLLTGHKYALFTYGPWCFLSTGVLIWLIPHFRTRKAAQQPQAPRGKKGSAPRRPVVRQNKISG